MDKTAEIVATLAAKGLKVAIAESLTGGAIAAALVSVAGASAVLDEAMITYSNAAKVARLGVLQTTLDTYGAVSPQTAQEMAAGIARTANARIGLATTGIAGPGGGTPQKPVGLVYIALHVDGNTTARKFNFYGDRQAIINQTVFQSLQLLGGFYDCNRKTN
ncbi:MAG: CinA family protein [Defluviitaleaceae bacterium]|nr:CinA family protein [Defluviitaleaceae bacterium]